MSCDEPAPGAAESSEVDARPPSEDQVYFNESFRAGIRGLGEIVRKRRRKGEPTG